LVFGRVGGDPVFGGLVGWNVGGNTTTSIWDSRPRAGLEVSGTGKTTAERQAIQTFPDARWDFVGERENRVTSCPEGGWTEADDGYIMAASMVVVLNRWSLPC
jgi:hypothetical protein